MKQSCIILFQKKPRGRILYHRATLNDKVPPASYFSHINLDLPSSEFGYSNIY